MKEKPDVLQGTLALMVLKTLDVLGPQHGYGIARRIEQISGDLLAVNQGTLYPLLLKLEHEGSIASRMGRIGKQPPRPLLSPYRGRPQAAAGRDPRLGANRGDHRALLRGQSGGSAMKFLRRFFMRLSNLCHQAAVPTNACVKRWPSILRFRLRRICAPACRPPRRAARRR